MRILLKALLVPAAVGLMSGAANTAPGHVGLPGPVKVHSDQQVTQLRHGHGHWHHYRGHRYWRHRHYRHYGYRPYRHYYRPYGYYRPYYYHPRPYYGPRFRFNLGIGF